MRLVCMREWVGVVGPGRRSSAPGCRGQPKVRLRARRRESARLIGRDSWLGRTSPTGVPPRVSHIGRLEARAACLSACGELSGVLVHGAVDQLAAADGLRERDSDWGLRVR